MNTRSNGSLSDVESYANSNRSSKESNVEQLARPPSAAAGK